MKAKTGIQTGLSSRDVISGPDKAKQGDKSAQKDPQMPEGVNKEKVTKGGKSFDIC